MKMENRMEQLENYKAVILEIRMREDFKRLGKEDQEYITHMIKKNLLESFPLNGNMLNLASKHIPHAKVIAHAVVDQYFEVFSY